MWPVWLYCLYCTLSHKRQNFGEYLLNTKCVFWISVQILSQTLFILITLQSHTHITITVPTVYCKLLAFLSEFSRAWIFDRFSEILHISRKFFSLKSNFSSKQKDGQTHLTKLTVAFHRLLNTSKERKQKIGHDLQSYRSLAHTAIGHQLLSQSVLC